MTAPAEEAVLVATAGAADTAPAALSKAWAASWSWRIARHRGRAETVSDARVVARFPGALGAVRCALAVEADLEGFAQRLPRPASLAVRIGIASAVGDAARLAELAPADGLAVSGAVCAEVERRLDLDAWPLDGGPPGAAVLARALRGRVFRFKPWTTRKRRAAGLIAAALVVAAVVVGLALTLPPAGGR